MQNKHEMLQKEQEIHFLNQKYELEKERKIIIETLLSDLKHRTQNNLQTICSLLHFQYNTLQDDKAKIAIQSIENRIESIMMLHKLLDFKESTINIHVPTYFNNLLLYLIDSYGLENKVKLIINIEDIDIDFQKIVPLALLVNELVTNAFKYAYVNQISPLLQVKIYKSSTDETLQLIVKDNGIHQNLELNFNGSSLGLKIVNLLSQQLKAKMNYQYQTGLEWTFDIPI